MALFTKLRSRTLLQFRNYCSPSAILVGDPKVILTSKEKSLAAISLIKSEPNPEKILSICRVAALTPESHHDRRALSVAMSRLRMFNYSEDIRVFFEELNNRPDMRNEHFVSHAIILYGRAGMIPYGITLFEEMEKMCIRRTVKSFNALLFSCIVARKYYEAKWIFTDFPSTYNIRPNVESYNTIIRAFGSSGESMAGYSIIAEMSRNGCQPNATTFANLIAGFYKEKKFEDVENVLKLMKEQGKKPTLNIYNVRIESLCKLGRSFEAKALFDDMVGRNWKLNNPDIFHNLIRGFCKEGKYEDAKKIFKSMTYYRCIRTRRCYLTLLFFLCEGGDFVSALQIFKGTVKRNWFPSVFKAKFLVDGLISISKVEEAKEVIEIVKVRFPKNADMWKETEEKLIEIGKKRFPMKNPWKETEEKLSGVAAEGRKN